MHRVLIFGGTTEGRELSEFCVSRGIFTQVCVATPYGEELLSENGHLKIRTGRLSEKEMEALIRTGTPSLIIDATHPYAKEATENIRSACAHAGRERYRIVRESGGGSGAEECGRYFDTMDEIVSYLNMQEGNALVTTGSKAAAAYLKVKDYPERIWLRVLNDTSVINECVSLGFPREHILSGRGPFSKEENDSQLRSVKASFLVTKDSGKAGGFYEKLAAAKECGVEALILRRPKEDGITAEQMKEIIAREFSFYE